MWQQTISCNLQDLISREAWKVNCSYRSGYPLLSVSDWLKHAQHLALQRSIHFTAFLTHSLSLSFFLSPSFPALPLSASHSLHFSSTISLPLQTPVSTSLSLFYSHHPPSPLSSTLSLLCWYRGMQYVASCGSLAVGTWDSAPWWVTFTYALSETVLEQVCIFYLCCVYVCALACFMQVEHSVERVALLVVALTRSLLV